MYLQWSTRQYVVSGRKLVDSRFELIVPTSPLTTPLHPLHFSLWSWSFVEVKGESVDSCGNARRLKRKDAMLVYVRR